MDLHHLDVRSPRAIVAAIAAVCACSAFVPSARAAAESTDAGWLRPVDGPVVRPFDKVSSPYAAGHRGVDFAAAPGTPVRAANDGVVTFAGSVADTLHVVVLHAGNLRTSYSFLAGIDVHAGQQVQRGDIVGRSGGTGPEHDGSVLHFGLRAGDTYLDPMLLFRPADLTKVVHLVPAHAPDERVSSRRARSRGRAPRGASAAAGSPSCGSGRRDSPSRRAPRRSPRA